LCNRTAERIALDVVRETAPAGDLDHGKPLAMSRLERLVAGDVDLAELERELLPQRPNLLEGALAEVAALRVIDDDLYGHALVSGSKKS
jgi:hypothetical protein